MNNDIYLINEQYLTENEVFSKFPELKNSIQWEYMRDISSKERVHYFSDTKTFRILSMGE